MVRRAATGVWTWLTRGLRGVATKYRPNHLAWMRVSEWYGGHEALVISSLPAAGLAQWA